MLHAAFDTAYFLERLRPDDLLWSALWLTVVISVVAQLVGTLLGVVLAMGALSRWRIARVLAGLYTWVFRGTPVLLQISFWYFGSNLLFGFELIPRTVELGPLEMSGNVLAGIIALSLNEAAYMGEIVRAGILAVDEGQTEAALVVGMTERAAMRRIVLPQAARLIVPGLGNEFNNMLKTSSLVSVIGVTELFANGQVAYSVNFKYVEVFAAVACWYLLLTTVWMFMQVQLERRLGRSERKASESFAERIFGVGAERRTYS
ncbi:MAG: amino acid transporter rane protein family [Thermoleophilia bacterium]|nr:amino acid transporter rane protein family [Thermoleophilia bacterium]